MNKVKPCVKEPQTHQLRYILVRLTRTAISEMHTEDTNVRTYVRTMRAHMYRFTITKHTHTEEWSHTYFEEACLASYTVGVCIAGCLHRKVICQRV